MRCKKNNRFYYWSIAIVINFLLISSSTAEDKILITQEQLPIGHQSTYPKISKEQYTQCVEKLESINLTIKKLNKQVDRLANYKNNLDEFKHDLEIKRTQLDFHNPDSVLSYNHLNQKLNQLSLEYNLEVENYSNAVKEYYSENEILKTECHEKQF